DGERDLLVAREVDEVGDEGGEALHLRDEVLEQLLALDRIGGLAAREELEVRAQARERRAQLVRRVGDELPLLSQRHLERREHGVEAAGEARDLIAARERDTAREVTRARDLLDRRRESAHRLQRRTRQQQA